MNHNWGTWVLPITEEEGYIYFRLRKPNDLYLFINNININIYDECLNPFCNVRHKPSLNNVNIANFIKNTPVKKQVQKHTNINVKVDLGKINANKYILYFAALPSNFKTIRPSKLAYGNFKNKGVTKLNKHGKAILKIKCPQCYSDDDGKNKKAETFYRHVHFCLANKDNTQWNPTLYTKIVICDLSYFKMKSLHSNGNVVLINALPCEYYAKDHINGN